MLKRGRHNWASHALSAFVAPSYFVSFCDPVLLTSVSVYGHIVSDQDFVTGEGGSNSHRRRFIMSPPLA